MTRYKVSPLTVTRALSRLSAEGLVVTRPGSGTYVAERRHPLPADLPDYGWQSMALGDRSIDASGVVELVTQAPDGVIALSGGYLAAELQPLQALTASMKRAAGRVGSWERPPMAGLAELREWFARTSGTSAADVTITGGGQAAVSLALRALLPHGAPLLVESPTYLGVLAIARAAGLRPVPVPIDEDGLPPELLAEAFAATGARAVYCQPRFHNPTGTVLSAQRRGQVLAVARAAGAFVVEDDFARDLAIEPAPPSLISQDRHGTVVHIASLTKVTAPSLRIAAVIARGPVTERIRASQLVDALFVCRPLQEAAVELVNSPAWQRHLQALSAALRKRRDTLAGALATHLPLPVRVPTGGLHLWARLPDGTDDGALAARALQAGVLISSGRRYFPAEPPAPFVRLSYGTAATEGDLSEGVVRLARVVTG
jgi:DNA-binding transcriptional MocR family regulator